MGVHRAATRVDDVHRGICQTVRFVLENFSQLSEIAHEFCVYVCVCVCLCARARASVRAYQRVRGTDCVKVHNQLRRLISSEVVVVAFRDANTNASGASSPWPKCDAERSDLEQQ